MLWRRPLQAKKAGSYRCFSVIGDSYALLMPGRTGSNYLVSWTLNRNSCVMTRAESQVSTAPAV